MGLFGLPDQCLDVVDPVTQVIDRISQRGTSDDASQYLVRRISSLDEDTLTRVLRLTFGNALRAERDAIAARQATILRRANANLEAENPDIEEWKELAAQTATSPAAVAGVAAAVPDPVVVGSWDFPQLLRFVVDVLLGQQGLFFGLVDPSASSLDRILPRQQDEDVGPWEDRWRAALGEVLPLWLEGAPISAIGEVFHRHRGTQSQARAVHLGRRFATQTSVGIGHGVSLVCRVMERKIAGAIPSYIAEWLALLPGCFREGFNNPDKLLLFWCLRRQPGLHPRVRVHRKFDEIESSLPKWIDVPAVDGRRAVIRGLASVQH